MPNSREELEKLIAEMRNDPQMREFQELLDFISDDINNPNSQITPCQARNIAIDKMEEGLYRQNVKKLAEMLYNGQFM